MTTNAVMDDAALTSVPSDISIDFGTLGAFRQVVEESGLNINSLFSPERVTDGHLRSSVPLGHVLYDALMTQNMLYDSPSLTSSSDRLGVDTIVSQLINSLGIDIEAAEGISGRTLLHQACANEDILFIRRLLFDHCANIYVKDVNGNTPFMYACMRGHFAIALLLMRFGAEVNTANDRGDQPLHLACKIGASELVNLILSKTDDESLDVNATNLDGETALHQVVSSPDCNLRILQMLLDHPSIDIDEINSLTLCSALDDGILTFSFDAIRMLLSRIKFTFDSKHRAICLLYHQLQVHKWNNDPLSRNSVIFSNLLEILHIVLHQPIINNSTGANNTDEHSSEHSDVESTFHIHYHATHYTDKLKALVPYSFVEVTIPAVRRPEYEKEAMRKSKESKPPSWFPGDKYALHSHTIQEKVSYTYNVARMIEVCNKVSRESRPNRTFYDEMTAHNYYYHLHRPENDDCSGDTGTSSSATNVPTPQPILPRNIFGEVTVSFLQQSTINRPYTDKKNINLLSTKEFACSDTFGDIFDYIHSDLGLFPDTFHLQHRATEMEISIEAFSPLQIQELFGRDIQTLDFAIIHNSSLLSTTVAGEVGIAISTIGDTAANTNTTDTVDASTASCVDQEVLEYNEEDYESDIVYEDDDYYVDEDDCCCDDEEEEN